MSTQALLIVHSIEELHISHPSMTVILFTVLRKV